MVYLYPRKPGPLAQLVEQLTLNQEVTGSIPVWPTIYKASNRGISRGFVFLVYILDAANITVQPRPTTGTVLAAAEVFKHFNP